MARIRGTRFNDKIKGTKFHDDIRGGNGNDHINGKGGNDVVKGERGNDHIAGGKGNDKMVGGPGHDVFVFHNGDGSDLVKDYHDGVDKFDIPASAFLPSGTPYAGSLGTGLIVTYFDAGGHASGEFLVLGYSLPQFSIDDFI